MISNNMRLDAFLHHIPQDVPVLLFDLASKDNSKHLYPDARRLPAANLSPREWKGA